YLFPESAATVLSKTAAYSEWRARPLAMVPGFPDIRVDAAKEIVKSAFDKGGTGWLSWMETHGVLNAFGIPQAPGGVARGADEAASIARSLGFPVAAKLASSRVLHKTDMGAIRLNLESEAAVRQAFEQIKQEDMEGVLIQRMIRRGVELMIGVAEDVSF